MAFSSENFECPRIISDIVRLLPICQQLRKRAADDITNSSSRLEKHGSELKFFASISRKLDQIKI